MAKGFFRELKHYTLHSISKELGENIEKTKCLVGILKKYGVIKAVKKSKPEFEDLSNQDIVLTDVTENTTDVEYVFDYVGVVLLEGHVFKCYPKYILSTNAPIQELKKVLRVIKKYNSNEQLVYLYNGEDDNKIFNRLAVSLHLLEEYFMYGIYTNQHEIIETNGEGEILWNRTIDETFAMIQDNRPYYVELQTQNVVDNDMDFFKQLHECVLTQCSTELKDTGLLQLFEITGVELTDCPLVDFGDIDYILYRLQQEIQVQYVTRKQNLLKTLYTFIANDKTDREDISFSLYGTNNFNLVWEKVCANNFGSVLDEKIRKLPLGVSPEYRTKKNDTLRSIIDRPVWHRKNPLVSDSNVDTLRPDIICIYPCNEQMDYCFGIYDAKYYTIDFVQQTASWKVTGQPGVGDVSKQYLYQLAYDDFITKQGYKYVQNMFLCPQEEAEPDYGYVEMKMLHTVGDKNLENIAVVKLSASVMYDIYLANRKNQNISKYIPQVGKKRVLSPNFANRMMTYLKRINQISSMEEEKLEMKEERGKLIYPQQIKREIGAKIIYDVICSVASVAVYGFDPYEKVNGNMVAEDVGNSHSKCDQIANAALKIESKIKELSEQELRDDVAIRVILKNCFEGLDDINSIAEGNSLDKLTDGIMELIMEVYL